MYQAINRKLRRIEGQIKANERTYDTAIAANEREMEAVDTYIHTGIMLQQKLQHYVTWQARRFDTFEQRVVEWSRGYGTTHWRQM